MIELDGIEYNVATPQENTAEIVNEINQYCSENNVQNADGDVIQVDVNQANPLYAMIQGFAYLVSRLQQLLYSAGCALSIPSSSERQLLAIADMAGVRRKEATKTTITATVYAVLASSFEPVDCRITTELSMTILTTSGTVVFHPAFDITVPVGSSRSIVLIAEQEGSFSINANDTASFDVNPTGFRKMSALASVPGQSLETITSLRARIQRRAEQGSMVDNAMAAITQLDGVALCNIYFNKSSSDNQLVMGITVPPRQALVFVQGWSNDIAKTFYSNMFCDCAGQDSPNAVIQKYVSRAGQEFVVPIFSPQNVPAFIRIYFTATMDDATKQSIRDEVCLLSRDLTIGQALLSADVIHKVKEAFPSYEIAGAQVSMDNTSYSYQVTPSAYQLIVFNPENIQVITPDVTTL